VVVDVTGGRRAEHALRIAQERLQLALEGTRTGTYEWDVVSDEIRWSDNLGPMYGHPRGWAPAGYAAYLETVHPDDREALAQEVQAALATPGTSYEVDFRALRTDGTQRWMSTRGHVVRDDAGRPEALVGLVSDMHDRRLTQLTGEFLAQASLELAESLDPEETLRHVAQLAIGELADWCTVHVMDPDGELRRVAVAHRDPAMVRFADELAERYPDDAEAARGVPHVIRTRQSELIADITDAMLVQATRDAEHLRMARGLELRSAMVVPMVARGVAVGAISFFYAGEGRRYDEATLALAEEVGRRAGLALANARLHRAQQVTTRRLLQLQTVTDVALSRLGLDDLLQELLTRVRDLLDADFAVCLLLDADEQALRVRATLGFEYEERAELRVPLGEGIAGRIALESEPVMIEDVAAAQPVSPQLKAAAQSLLGVPLRVDGATLGVLHVATREARRFGEDEAQLLMLVGDRVARAVAQTAAFERARDTALTLQRSLLPARVPAIEGFELATRYLPGQAGSEVGGDWYDVIALPDGRHGICVGDVVGRGVSAAAVMGRLRASVRACLHVAAGPAEAMEQLDDLVAASEEDPFATVLIAVLDAATGRAELCSAGHPAPLLAQDGDCRFVDIDVGPPVGAPRTPRRTTVVDLPVGSSLLLYTDGLVERRETPLDRRLEELRAVVAAGPKDPEAQLDHVVASMLGDRTGADDVALIGAWRRR
jgi:serine phosphatase RsbU (regulator of sigma subunit)